MFFNLNNTQKGYESLFTSLEKLAEQEIIENEEGEFSFEDKSKMYVTMDWKGNFTTISGLGAKKQKNLSKKELVDCIDNFVTSDIAESVFKKLNSEKLSKIKNGIENLKKRIEKAPVKKESRFEIFIGQIQNFAIQFFGYSIAKNNAMEKLNRAILLVEEQMNNKKIEVLQKNLFTLPPEKLDKMMKKFSDIKNFEEDFDKVFEQSPAEKAEETARFEKIEDEISFLNLRKKEILKQRKFQINIPSLKAKIASPLSAKLETELETANKINSITEKLGFNFEDGNSEYIIYMRKAIFGFSIGQKKKLFRFQSEKMDAYNLKTTCLGGDTTLQLFYFSFFLEHLFKSDKMDHSPEYVQGLEKLKSDIDRSLFISLHMHERKLQNEMGQEALFDELDQMKPGQNLFIPIRTNYAKEGISHATLLVFEKLENGNIRPIYYNTNGGSSIELAKKRASLGCDTFIHNFNDRHKGYDRSLFFPISISFAEINWREKKESIQNMMNNFASIKAQEETNTILVDNFGIGDAGKPKRIQINGICSFQCLTEAIKDHLETKENYLKFKRDFLSHIQEEFQVITDAMKPLIDSDKEVAALYPLHQQLLNENAKEIEIVKKSLIDIMSSHYCHTGNRRPVRMDIIS